MAATTSPTSRPRPNPTTPSVKTGATAAQPGPRHPPPTGSSSKSREASPKAPYDAGSSSPTHLDVDTQPLETIPLEALHSPAPNSTNELDRTSNPRTTSTSRASTQRHLQTTPTASGLNRPGRPRARQPRRLLRAEISAGAAAQFHSTWTEDPLEIAGSDATLEPAAQMCTTDVASYGFSLGMYRHPRSTAASRSLRAARSIFLRLPTSRKSTDSWSGTPRSSPSSRAAHPASFASATLTAQVPALCSCSSFT